MGTKRNEEKKASRQPGKLQTEKRPARADAKASKEAAARTSTPHFRYRYLMGAMQQNMLTQTVRLMCIDEDVQKIPEFTQAWRAASTRMASLAASEGGLPDAIQIADVPDSTRQQLAEIERDPLFRASFSAMPTTFKVIDVNSMIAPQREVNLDYVEEIQKRVPGTTIESLVDFCVGPRAQPPELRTLQTAANQMTYSSRSLDIRFLGGFPKAINESDRAAAHAGGQPVEVVTLLVGFGAAPINGWLVGKRFVLGNGFHRVVALRMSGITRIPVVVQDVSNAELEFPPNYLGLPRNYLLQAPRPVLVKDFFDQDLVVELRLKPRRKVVKVSWGEEDSVAPD